MSKELLKHLKWQLEHVSQSLELWVVDMGDDDFYVEFFETGEKYRVSIEKVHDGNKELWQELLLRCREAIKADSSLQASEFKITNEELNQLNAYQVDVIFQWLDKVKQKHGINLVADSEYNPDMLL
jgi:hypothetical protein